MKTTTFYINKSNKNNSNNNHSFLGFADYSKMLDAIITSNVKAKNPYLFGEDYDLSDLGYSTKKPVKINITLNKKKSCNGCPLKDICDNSYTIDTFMDAVKFLNSYEGKDDYDFKLFDGTPVKFFGNTVQIGYDLYYIKNNDYSSFYDMLDEPTKKNIIDIYIKLK